MYMLKGNTTHINMDPMVTDYINKNSNKSITIIRQIIFVNKIHFFATIISNTKFTTINWITNKTLAQLMSLIVTLNSIYSKRRFDLKIL